MVKTVLTVKTVHLSQLKALHQMKMVQQQLNSQMARQLMCQQEKTESQSQLKKRK